MKKVKIIGIILSILVLVYLILTGCPNNIFYGLEPRPNDSEGPELTIINPEENQIVSGSLAIVGISTDKYQIDYIRYKIDTGAYILMNGTYTFNAVLNTTLLVEGDHTITIEGADKFGNTTSITRTIKVDQEIPNVSVTMDYQNYQNYIRGTNIVLSGDAIDDNGVSLIQISFDGGLNFIDTVKSADLLNPTWSYTITDTSTIKPGGGGDGLVTVILRVLDVSELRGSTSFPLYVDNTDPAITISLPVNDTTIDSSEDLTNDLLVVAGLCSDNIAGGIKDITISIPGIIPPVVTTNFTTQYLEYIDISSIKSDGLKEITVTINDKAGNTASVPVNIALDDTPPEFSGNIGTGKGNLSSDLMLKENNFKEGTFTISGNVTDPDGAGTISSVRITLIDSLQNTVFSNLANYAAGSFSYNWVIDGSVPEGIYTLKIRVSDAVEGFDTKLYTVRVDKTIPVVVISAPLVNSRVAGNAVNVAGLAESSGSGIYSVTYQFTDADNPGNNSTTTYTRPGFAGLSNNDVADGTSYDFYFSRGWDTTAFSIGFDITITINAEDLAGNASSTTSLNSIIVQKDPTTPQISVETYDHPTNALYTGKTVINGRYVNGSGTLHGTATDDSQVVSIEIKIDSGAYTPLSITPSSLVNWDYTLPNLSEGLHALIFKVTDDTSGTPKILEAQIQLNIDNNNPVLSTFTLTLQDNSGTSYLHGLVDIAGTSNDAIAGVESVVITVNETAIPANADALSITGTTSFSGVWDTEALPADGPTPVIAKDGITMMTTVTDKAGNTISDIRSENVRPYVISVSKTTAYLGEASIVVAGHNFFGNSVDYTTQPSQNFISFGDTRSNVNCTADNTLNPNTITVSIPSGFTSLAVTSYGLSSGSIIVNTAGVTNASQNAMKIDLFFTQNIYTLNSPNYPSVSVSGSTRAVAFAIGTNPRTFGLMTDSGTNTIQPSALTGGTLNLTSLAYVNDSLQYITMYSTKLTPSGIWIWRSSNKFVSIDGGFPKLIAADGTYSSVKVDVSGNVHVAYYESSTADLKYKKSNDQGGTFSSAVTLDGSATSVGTWLSMALSSSGNPYIVYYDDGNNSLKLVYSANGGISWAAPITISSNNDGNFGNGVVIDDTGGIHISYYNGNSGDLMYAYAANYTAAALTGFTITTVDTLVIAGMFSSIALDSGNNPHITYADFTNIRPKYAYRIAGVWKKTYIAETNDFVLNANSNYTATVVDSNGFIRMIYPTTAGIREAIYLKED